MGSYAECWLGGVYVGSSKNDVDPSLIDHFRPSDKRIIRDPKAKLPPELARWVTAHSADDGDFLVVYYEISRALLRDRLEVFGYTLDNCRTAFDRAVTLKHRETIARAAAMRSGNDTTGLSDHYEQEARVLKQMTAEKWTQLVRACAKDRLIPRHGRDFYEGPNKGTLLGYMLTEHDDWYGCPVPDTNIPLRLLIDTLPEGALIYDITNLVLGGYVEEDEDFVDLGIRTAAEEYSYRARTLVLTEGRSDSEILRESMALLYPHLVDYFSFMDFEASRAEGGASRLAQLVKSFAGAGIVNRTVALFDNDAAGAVAIASLKDVTLPSHIVVRKLPDLEMLCSYPTFGPTGLTNTNVNGTAASMELMLGSDVLADETHGYIPVQWTGLERSLGRYQGEVMDKARLQDRYRSKLAKAKTDMQYAQSVDWNGMRKVLV